MSALAKLAAPSAYDLRDGPTREDGTTGTALDRESAQRVSPPWEPNLVAATSRKPAHLGSFLPTSAGRDLISRSGTFSAYGQPGQLSALGKDMGKNTRANCVNAQLKLVKQQVKAEVTAWAKSDVVKALQLRTGFSDSRIQDWRSGRFGANAASLEIIRRDKLAFAREQMAEARAVIRQSLGPLAEQYPDAVELVLRGQG